MTERPDELERILTDLAPRIAFPPVPDLAASVHAALAAEPARVWPIRSTPDWRHTRRWLALAAAILLLAVIGTVAIPRARHAVADWLGLPGIHIVIEHGHPRPTATPRAGAGSPPYSSASRCRCPISRASPVSRCACRRVRYSGRQRAPMCGR